MSPPGTPLLLKDHSSSQEGPCRSCSGKKTKLILFDVEVPWTLGCVGTVPTWVQVPAPCCYPSPLRSQADALNHSHSAMAFANGWFIRAAEEEAARVGKEQAAPRHGR